jgi:hypothetical protein
MCRCCPAQRPQTPDLLSSSNRGRVSALLHNKHHKQEFCSMGLKPLTAFACGFFFLCQPNALVTALYIPF